MSIDREIAHAKTIATVVHRGQLDGDGTPVLDRLAITVSLLQDFEDPVLPCTAWLQYVPSAARISGRDLLRLGVSRDIVTLVQTLQPVGDETEAAMVRRIGRSTNPAAALVKLASRLVLSGGRMPLSGTETGLSRAAGGFSALVLTRAREHFSR
ncbi:hypothetical protein [Ornithinimicrobium murale]|uniref:hypothetical protein n=1 Tax=Ornithinimicrobium murale TaxID=1050153 RepID=UPI000E0DBDA6|nr:hypothetical protein [Ornithinimicrobium murale]